MKQELWTLSMKGDDIDGYTNRFQELAGLPERIQGNVTSSRPANIHEAVTMARELVDQSVRAKATRVNVSNKRRWEDHQRNNNNNRSNTHHQQQLRVEVMLEIYHGATDASHTIMVNV
ncbi:hypothetical protein Tco_0350762, partial [Tanacetum coccineum]